MKSVRIRATIVPTAVSSGKRIPPPPPFAPPSLPDTDGLLTTYSRTRSTDNSRSVSPDSPSTREKETQAARWRGHLGRNEGTKLEQSENKANIVTDLNIKTKSEINIKIQAPEMRIEPPTPPIERKLELTKNLELMSQRIYPEPTTNNISSTNDKILNTSELPDEEAVQTQEMCQLRDSQHYFDEPEAKSEKIQENVEMEEESLCEKFPLQEEKQIKYKLRRRVSKKGTIKKSNEMNEDNKIVQNNTNNENIVLKIREIKEMFPCNKTEKLKEIIYAKDMKALDVDIPETKKESQDASKGLNVTEIDAMGISTSVEAKFMLERNKHVEKVHEEDDDILPKHAKNEPNDIVHEILGSCDHVNKILDRILDSKRKLDDDESDKSEETEGLVSNIYENINDKEKHQQLRPKVDSSLLVDLPEPIDIIENIADLTVEKVKEYLQLEEEVNETLKLELELTRKQTSEEAQLLSKLNSQSNSFVKPTRTPQLNDTNKKSERRKLNYTSKKEHQIEKIKEFLKDPDSSQNEEIQLNVRLKQSEKDIEELSKEVTTICDVLYLASYTALKETNLTKDGITSVIEISSSPRPLTGTDDLHIRLSEEKEITEDVFEKIADKVKNTKTVKGKVLISCEQSTGLSAVLCVPYLIKYEGMSSRKAVKIIEGKRPHAKIHAGTLVRIEEWERKLQGSKLSGGFLSLIASWLPMVFVMLLGYMVFRMVFDRVDREHMEGKKIHVDMYTKLYEYFDVRKWP